MKHVIEATETSTEFSAIAAPAIPNQAATDCDQHREAFIYRWEVGGCEVWKDV
jgi:hypothetical protein